MTYPITLMKPQLSDLSLNRQISDQLKIKNNDYFSYKYKVWTLLKNLCFN